jgi:thiol-disulfide isomerase/thioredoxin
MKKLILLIYTCMLSLNLIAQVKGKPQPFIIKGRLANCPEKQVKIFFRDKNNQLTIDTIRLDKDGNFYLKTLDVIYPQLTSIQQNNIQINNIFVAPGYNLTVTGDAKDFKSLYKSKKITGVGAESNNYRIMLDSVIQAKNDTTQYYMLNEADLLVYIKKSRAIKDSVAHVVFNKNAGKLSAQKSTGKKAKHDGSDLSLNNTSADKYLSYFGKMVRIDNDFSDLYMLMLHADMHNYTYDKSIALINNANPAILSNVFKDEYMASEYYKGFMASEYLTFWTRLDKLKDTTLRSHKQYGLEKINNTYKGAIKAYSLMHIMDSRIYFTKSLNDLSNYQVAFKPFVAALTNPDHKKIILKLFNNKEADLIKTQTGKPAPKFTLTSNTGQTASLDDFKGKVVYIDLWASWCAPCRQETPALKTLYAKYKNDSRIAIISIAVSDGIKEWNKAINEDKPDWLQLLDKEGTVSLNYAASMIPKFILIDKQGNLVSFNAPNPSSGQKIETLLMAEMVK